MPAEARQAGGQSAGRPILLYDGVCGLCNRLVRFVLARDRHDQFRFAPLQGEFARQQLLRHGTTRGALDTAYLVLDAGTPAERLLDRSDAVLEILRRLPGQRVLAALLAIVPSFLRTPAYNLVARTRYRLWGKYDSCPLPDPAQRDKFVDGFAEPAEIAVNEVATGRTLSPDELRAELLAILPPQQVAGEATRAACAIDGVLPAAVVSPASSEEVAAILRLASTRDLVVVPAGSCSRQEMGNIPPRVDILLRSDRLRSIRFAAQAGNVTAGAGARLGEIQEQLKSAGKFLPLDPAGAITVGGALATAAQGPLSHGYGDVSGLCTEMELVSGAGEMIHTAAMAPGQGQQLMRAVEGSCGVLAVIVSATFKIVPQPANTRTFVAPFLLANGAMQYRDRVLRLAAPVLCLELVSPRASDYSTGDARYWELLVRVAGDESTLAETRAELGHYLKGELKGEAEFRAWQAVIEFETTLVRRHANCMLVDVSVPPDGTAEAVNAGERIATENNFLCAQIGRVARGRLVMGFVPLGAPAATQYVNAVSALRGTLPPEASSVVTRCPAEVKSRVDVWGAAANPALRALKRKLDPADVLNRGRGRVGS